VLEEKMQPLFLIFTLLLPPTPLQAMEKWEICLDKADFTFNVDGFMGSTTISKNQCSMRFSVSGGKGEKYEIDLCDPAIHIRRYAAIDSMSSQRLVAGSAGCPRPLFGADFDENAQDIQEYMAARKKVFALWESVKKLYGEGSDQINLTNPKSFSPEVSAGKIACGQFLLKEYLQNCISFEGKKSLAPQANSPNIPGVHPQTILVPKK